MSIREKCTFDLNIPAEYPYMFIEGNYEVMHESGLPDGEDFISYTAAFRQGLSWSANISYGIKTDREWGREKIVEWIRNDLESKLSSGKGVTVSNHWTGPTDGSA